MPIPIISAPPTADSSLITMSVINGARMDADSVIEPWNNNMTMADNPTPKPRVEARTMETIPSRMAFVNSSSWLPVKPD